MSATRFGLMSSPVHFTHLWTQPHHRWPHRSRKSDTWLGFLVLRIITLSSWVRFFSLEARRLSSLKPVDDDLLVNSGQRTGSDDFFLLQKLLELLQRLSGVGNSATRVACMSNMAGPLFLPPSLSMTFPRTPSRNCAHSLYCVFGPRDLAGYFVHRLLRPARPHPESTDDAQPAHSRRSYTPANARASNQERRPRPSRTDTLLCSWGSSSG